MLARRLAALIVLALLLPLSASARPGGGHNFSSGGGHSGGGRSFGGSSHFTLPSNGGSWNGSRGSSNGDADGGVAGAFSPAGCGAATGMMFWLVVAIVVIGLVARRGGADRATRRAIEALAATRNAAVDLSGLEALRQRDPAFSLEQFLARARVTVESLNGAWVGRTLGNVRRLLSDAVYTRFCTQLALDEAQGRRNVMADAEAVSVEVAGIEGDGDWDTIHVKLSARARDADVPAGTAPDEADRIARRSPLEPYTEIWSFSRRVGAQTLARGVLEGRCPKCGADVPLADVIQCGYCRALVNSGVHDWVLAEITQITEWSPSSTGKAIPGMEQLKSRDPAFNRQHVEDRASLLFWKWIDARVSGDPRRLARFAVAPPESLGVIAAGAQPSAGLDRVAVGSADLVACDPAPTDGFDHVYVKVMWSAARDQRSEPTPISSVLILARREGRQTGAGLTSLACQECNGPLSESDAPTCEYCGAAIAGGAQEWALEQVTSPQGAERLRWSRAQQEGEHAPAGVGNGAIDIPDLRDPRERVLLLYRIAAVLAADGQVTPAERRLLDTMARRWSIDPRILAPALQPGAVVGPLVGIPPEDRVPFLAALVVAALVDGKVDARERALLDAVADSLTVPRTTVDALIRSGGRAVAAAAG